MDSEPLSSDTPPLADLPPQADTPQQADTPPDIKEANLLPQESGLAVLTKKKWWRNAFWFCFWFAPNCIKPALISIAMVTILAGTIVAQKVLLGSSDQPFNLIMGLVAFLVLLCAFFACSALIFWAFAIWLARLTAFAAAFNHVPRSQFLSDKIDYAASKQAQLKGMQEADQRKTFLAKFWSRLTLLLALPFILFIVPFFICGYASYVSQPAIASSATIPLPQVPANISLIAMITSLVLGNYIMVITFVGMVVSATTAELQSGPAAMETMVISHKKILPLFAITAAMLLLTVLISAPQEIIQRFVALPFVENNPFVMYAAEVWQSLTSVILLTFSLAPICEYLRSKPQ